MSDESELEKVCAAGRSFCFFLLLTGCLATPRLQAQTSNVALTVLSGGLRQSFAGFGASQASTVWSGIAATPRSQMADMVYRDLKMNVLRMWVTTTNSPPASTMLAEFNTRYVASGAIADITNRGVTTLLLAPAAGGGAPAPASISAYAANLAELIRQIKAAYHITVGVTGIANEPEPTWSSAQISDCVGSLRAALDSRGLTDVKIIAPETSSPGAAADTLDAACTNAAAWSSLFGIASHSYGSVLPDDRMEVRKGSKQWWMTEASAGGGEQAEDENRACSILARYLCEMNHGVDEWIFFIGLGQVSDNSTYTIGTAFLMVYDLKTSSIVPFLKYYYFKQALNTFDRGAVFRKCVSGSEGDMFLTSASGTNQNPALNIAAAYNPDGSWGVSVVNDTGVTGSPAAANNLFYPATPYTVTLTVEELTNTLSMDFTVSRSRANNHLVPSGTVTLTNGTGTFSLAARELVSLRSAATAAAIPPAPTGLTASGINAPVVLNWNNTVKAACWHVKRATASGGPYTTVGTTTTTRYVDGTAANGTVYYYVVSAANAVGESAAPTEVVASPSPFPWSNADIGSVSFTGRFTVSDNGVFTAYASGTTIGGLADSFNYTYTTLTGNGTLVARLAKARLTNNSKAGIMMCETLGTSPKAVCVIHDFNGAWHTAMMCSRTAAGAYGSWTTSGVTAVPVWFKLVRSGNTFTGSASTNGANWTVIDSRTVAMTNTLYLGLVDCANNTGLCEATFDNISAPCAAPAGLKKAAASPAQIKLGWTAAFGATGYTIKRAAVSGGPYTTLGTVTAPALSYADNTTVRDAKYYYVVSAVNSAGESANSAEMEAWAKAEVGTVFKVTCR